MLKSIRNVLLLLLMSLGACVIIISYLSGGVNPFAQVQINQTGETVDELVTRGISNVAEDQLRQIEDKVAEDAVSQYNIAKREGDKTQICVQAGLVSAAFLQAEDETNYKLWKKIQYTDCKKVGMNFN